MKAFIVDRYGKNGGVRFGEMPEPELRDADVLVRVHAAGVNVLDSKIRDGEFKLLLPYRLPLILGNDVAGVVMRVGSIAVLRDCESLWADGSPITLLPRSLGPIPDDGLAPGSADLIASGRHTRDTTSSS